MKSAMGILHGLEFLEDALFNEKAKNHVNGHRHRVKRDLSIGVYDFLKEQEEEEGDIAQGGERIQRSEQQEQILPQHEQHAHPFVQVCRSFLSCMFNPDFTVDFTRESIPLTSQYNTTSVYSLDIINCISSSTTL